MTKTFNKNDGIGGEKLYAGEGKTIYKGIRKDGKRSELIVFSGYKNSHHEGFNKGLQKWQNINEPSSPYVASILAWGISKAENHPFVELEAVDGIILEELLAPPNNPLLTIEDGNRLAFQLSAAIAHCQKLGLRHGAINTKNIKQHNQTGDYKLTNFDFESLLQQTENSAIRYNDNNAFKAPEQESGAVLFQSDVYAFGVVLHQAITGQLPARDGINGEAINNVFYKVRKQNLSPHWTPYQKEREAEVPAWMLLMLEKCLQYDPLKRFANAVSLYEYIEENTDPFISKSVKNTINNDDESNNIDPESYQQIVQNLNNGDEWTVSKKQQTKRRKQRVRSASLSKIIYLFFVVAGLSAFAYYSYWQDNGTAGLETSEAAITEKRDTTPTVVSYNQPEISDRNESAAIAAETPITQIEKKETPVVPSRTETKEMQNKIPEPTIKTPEKIATTGAKYKVRNKAYFHNEPDANTRRNAFIIHWNKAVLTPLQTENGFFYIVFTNHLGQTSKGWLAIKDLVKIEDE